MQSKIPKSNPYTRNVCDTLHETLRAFPELNFEFPQREYLEWTDFFRQKLHRLPAVLLQVAAHTLFTHWTRGKALLSNACALNRFLFIFSSNKGDLARGSPTLAEIFIIGIKNSWLWLNTSSERHTKPIVAIAAQPLNSEDCICKVDSVIKDDEV